VKALKDLEIFDQVRIIGIAKRLEEIYFPGDSVPLYIDKNSESLKVIQHLRNEAHRFGVNFHRQKRSLSMIKSRLEDIEGIGKNTIEKLIQSFGSVEQIKMLDINEIEKVIGASKAQKVYRAIKDE
jgi:excinuclease ABC subunit C